MNGLVAQLNRAPDSGSDGRGFESRRGHRYTVMMEKLKRHALVTVLLALFALCAVRASAQESNDTYTGEKHDSIEFSLLTCGAGNEIYSLFGHTAIRYRNITQGRDWTFNYGVFNFKQKHFAWRFATGKTDYELGVCPYATFVKEYAEHGRSITEQVLNLTAEQKVVLEYYLSINMQPENRTYRYNYFRRNCTTEARDKIFSVLPQYCDGEEPLEKQSFRQTIHEYTEGHEWSELAMDLCLGYEADRKQTKDVLEFLPFNLKQSLDSTSYIIDADTCRLVDGTHTIKAQGQLAQDEFPLTPLQSLAIVAIIIIVLFFRDFYKERAGWVTDAILLMMIALAGCVLMVIMLGEHPCVRYNLNFLLLNPLAFLAIPYIIIADRKRCHSRWWAYYEMVFLLLFIVDITGLQDIPTAVEVLASFLLIRSLERRILIRINKTKR